MDIALEHEIRQRAYAIWVAAGRNEGEAEAHWLHAERAVRTESKKADVPTRAAVKQAKPAKAVAAAGKTAVKKAAVKTAAVKATVAKAPLTKATVSRRAKAGSIEAVA